MGDRSSLIQRILSDSREEISLLCITDTQEYIITLEIESLPVNENKILSILDSLRVQSVRQQDRYTFLSCLCTLPLKVTIVSQPTTKDIQKYEDSKRVKVIETPSLYREVVESFIQREIAYRDYSWIERIAKGDEERILYSSPDFTIIPDIYWDERSESLHVLAFVHDRNIRSLRDLRGFHIPLLISIKDIGCDIIRERYGISDQIETSIHYHPSYYWLHIHFTLVASTYLSVGRSILLDDVISNLERDSLYYRDSTLIYYLKENHPLMYFLQDYS